MSDMYSSKIIKPYTLIFNEILENEELNIHEQSLLIALISYYNYEKGYAYPSYKDLAKRSKIKKDTTITKYTNSLIEKGYLKKETIDGKGCKYFLSDKLLHTPKIDSVSKKNNLSDADSTTPKKTNNDTDLNMQLEKILKQYPNPKGKSKAFKILPKIIEDYGYEQILRAIARYNEEVKNRDSKFIKHMDTFFTKGDYTDYLDKNFNDIKSKEQLRKNIVTDDILIIPKV